jgi:GGDEF domain-containing protein
LPNRVLLLDRLNHAIARARAGRCGFALLFIDLDRFKQVNDLLGHAVGDALLVQAAKRIGQCLRPCHTVARLGGESAQVSASMGIALYPDAELPEILMRNADQAMYQAKAAGCNQLRFFKPALRPAERTGNGRDRLLSDDC